jgi:serine protease Do
VIAIGNALGYGQSVTKGIVSALNRDLEMEGFDSKLIQTDAAINPGNSGGALLNANGELIGINTVKVNANAVEGMGYAIPISDANEVIETLMNRTTRSKVPEKEQGYLGIQGVDVTSDSAQMYNMPTGVYIAEVVRKGGADKAGISKGSIITKFDGITIDSMATLQEQLKYFRAGEEVEVVIQVPTSNGEYKEQTVTVTLGKRS